MSMGAPRVSICVPTFEQVTYLERTLRSIGEQEYQDVEVIISDDSRTDGVRQLVERMAPVLGGRMRYVRNERPLGPPANWNACIALGCGELVKIMHHDEWFASPTSLGSFVELLDRTGSDLVFSAVRTTVVSSGHEWVLCPTDAEVGRVRAEPDRNLLSNIVGPPSATLYRRSLGLRYDEHFQYVVDMVFYRDAFERHRVTRTPQVLICSVSDAGHNVSSRSKTPEVELKEYVDAFAGRWARMAGTLRRDVERFMFGLLVVHQISSARKFRRIHPTWAGEGPYPRLLRMAWLYRSFRPLKALIRG